MKIRYLAPFAMAAMAAMLAGCATTPHSNVNAFRMKDGETGYGTSCHGWFSSSKTCHRTARATCGDQPVRVLDDSTLVANGIQPPRGPRELVFACGAAPAPAPAPVAAAPAPQEFTLDANLLFQFNSASLKSAEGHRALDKVVHDIHSQYRTISSVEIRGYTDRIGKDEYNLKLSQARADKVRDYLVHQGLDENAVSAKGMGKADPVSQGCPDGKSAKAIACLAPDRRVVIDVTGEKQ